MQVTTDRVLLVITGCSLSFVVFGLIMDGSVTAFRDPTDILISHDAPITDDTALCGMGGGLRPLRAAHPDHMRHISPRTRAYGWHGCRLSLPGNRFRAVRQEPAQRVARDRRHPPLRTSPV